MVYGLLLLIHDWSSPLAPSPSPEAFPRVPLMVHWCLNGFGPLWFSLDPKREQNSGVQIRWGPNPLEVQIRWRSKSAVPLALIYTGFPRVLENLERPVIFILTFSRTRRS